MQKNTVKRRHAGSSTAMHVRATAIHCGYHVLCGGSDEENTDVLSLSLKLKLSAVASASMLIKTMSTALRGVVRCFISKEESVSQTKKNEGEKAIYAR